MQNRNLYINIWNDLAADKHMIFLVGPRQVGKTTLAHFISESFSNSLYFNWDIHENRVHFIQDPYFFETVERKDPSPPLIIFDEIHKYKDWKNYLKGVYDRFHKQYRFLVSGSGRLDVYQKGGDSLAGRYFLFHLWPFTIAELGGKRRDIDEFLAAPLELSVNDTGFLQDLWTGLSELSGFPEPYLTGRERRYRRWSNMYSQQLIREDITDLTGIRSVADMETLYFILPSKVGSPLSVPSLAKDLKVSYNTVQSWLSVFERFFLIFSISPWTSKISRAIQKERKVYLMDTPRIKDAGARFENMVALELWRAVTGWNDTGYGTFSLHFIKNKEQQEVDFLIAKDHEPFLLIESKFSDAQPSPSLRKFQSVLEKPALQLVGDGESFRLVPNGDQQILIAPAYHWLSRLP